MLCCVEVLDTSVLDDELNRKLFTAVISQVKSGVIFL